MNLPTKYKLLKFQCTIFITKSQQKKKSVSEKGQKQVTDVYVHLLKVPSSKRSPPKRLFERFYRMDLFLGFYVIYKNLVLSYSPSRVSLN